MAVMLKDADDDFLESLAGALPQGRLKPVEPRYLEEPRGRWHGRAAAVVAPGSTDEVATVIRLAGEAGVGVVPYGGGTGLVSGQIAETGAVPILLSMERMTALRGLWPAENAIAVEAGATLGSVQEAAREAGRIFPLSYASEGSAQIGAALAINSGGINVLRYGTAGELCLGIEAVLPDGAILHGLRRLRKDNTGYDIRRLLIGSEGTLGVITAASLRLFPAPRTTCAAFLDVPGPEAALALLARAQAHLGEGVTAFELIRGMALSFLEEAKMDLRHPFASVPDWAVLTEIGLSHGDAEEALTALLEEAIEAGEVSDGVVAQSERQRDAFWAIREAIPEANRIIGSIGSHDVSLPLSEIAAFLEEGERVVAGFGPLRANAFGHLGDGNLHYNVFPPMGVDRAEFDGIRKEISRAIHDLVVAKGGSFSAEHGIGRLKVGDLERYGDPTRLEAMRRIKAALDPKGIMNPGAVLRT